MANLFTTLRRKTPSKRAMLAIGGAAAITVGGIAQTVDTMAAENDSTTATVSQISSKNFYPVPVVGKISCSTKYNLGAARDDIRVSWTSLGAGYSYVVETWKDNTSKVATTTVTSSDVGHVEGITALYTSYRVRVLTKSTVTNEVSTGYSSITIRKETSGSDIKCQTQWDPENVTSWQQTADWTPATQVQRSAASGAEKAMRPGTESPSTEAAPSTSESEKPAAPSTSESEKPTEPSTTPPTTSTESSAPAPAGDVTVDIEVAGTDRRAVVKVDGVQKCSIPLNEGESAAVGNNQVSIVNAEARTSRTVDLDNCPNED